MAVEIRTPFPSLETVAKAVGLPLKRAREIERMVSWNGNVARSRPAASRHAAKTTRSRARPGRR